MTPALALASSARRRRPALPALLAAVLVTGIVAIGLTGCRALPVGPGRERPVGTLLQSWSQSTGQDTDREQLEQLVGRVGVRIITTQEELEVFEQGLADISQTLRSVDLSKGFLVIGGYYNCQGSSSVTYAESERRLTFTSHQPDDIACAWSPYTVDVWHVSRDAVGGADPGSLSVRRA